MVVPVLITNCHVSLNAKKGPVNSHVPMMATAVTKTKGRPQMREVHLAKMA